MNTPITVLAPIKLASNRTEEELINASHKFEKEFASKEEGILRRELIRISEGEYMDIVQFRSQKDAEEVIEKEQNSPVCHEFFSVMDMSEEALEEAGEIKFYASLVTYS